MKYMVKLSTDSKLREVLIFNTHFVSLMWMIKQICDAIPWLFDNIRHTLHSIYLTIILKVQWLQISLHNDDNERV